MKFSIEKSQLKNILSTLQHFLDKKDLSQITSHIFIRTKNEKLILKASDYEIGLKIENLSAKVEKDGIATANGRQLLDIVKSLQDGEITISKNENFLIITQEHSIFKLSMFDAKEYQEFPSIDNKSKMKIDNVKFLEAIKRVIPSIDNHNSKFELNGALIDIKSDIVSIVSTDTKRLSIVKFQSNTNEELSIIVPKKSLIEIQRLFTTDIEIFFDNVNLIVKSSDYLLFTKLINGTFPNFEKIIPKNNLYKIKLPKEKILEEINLVTAISNEIGLILSSEKILFRARADDTSEAKSEFDFQSDLKEKLKIGINSKYLIDFLHLIDESEFELELNGENLPFIVKSKNFKTLITPIII